MSGIDLHAKLPAASGSGTATVRFAGLPALATQPPTTDQIWVLIRTDHPGCSELAHACGYDVQKFAELCHCSLRRLERVFCGIGRTPHNWLLEHRLLRELHLLEYLDATGRLDSIKRFAIESGYRHPGNFDRAFKKVFGMSPTTFLAERTKALQQLGVDLTECRCGRQSYPIIDL